MRDIDRPPGPGPGATPGPGRTPDARPRRRRRPAFARLWVAALFAVAVPGVGREACGQGAPGSPFSRNPPRGGSFSIPRPEPGQPNDRSRPSIPIPRPAPPGISPLAPLPVEEAPGRRGELPPLETPSELPTPLPPLPETPVLSPRVLPPRPEVAAPLEAVSTAPIPRGEPTILRAGLTATLRVCQVLPADGLTSGERLLNSRPPIQPGDRFLAELIDPRPTYPVLVGGTVTEITPPRRFGKPGYVSIQMAQLVQTAEGGTGWVPWRMDMADRRHTTRMRRVLLNTLLTLEGAGTGASIGAQFSGGNMAFIGGGMGIGALVGLGYSSFRRGTEADLEPGDTFEITVGTTQFRPVSREWQTILYPAADAGGGKHHK